VGGEDCSLCLRIPELKKELGKGGAILRGYKRRNILKKEVAMERGVYFGIFGVRLGKVQADKPKKETGGKSKGVRWRGLGENSGVSGGWCCVSTRRSGRFSNQGTLSLGAYLTKRNKNGETKERENLKCEWRYGKVWGQKVNWVEGGGAGEEIPPSELVKGKKCRAKQSLAKKPLCWGG